MFNFFKKSKIRDYAPVEATPRGIHHTVSFAISKDDSLAHIRREARKMDQARQIHQ